MRCFLWVMILGTGLGLANGCDRSPSPPSVGASIASVAPISGSGVGLIDLDQIARQMDWYDDMQRRLAALEQEQRVKLESLRIQLETTLQDERKRLGDKLTQEQQDRLAAMQMVAQRKLQEAQQQSQQESADARMKLITEFRNLVRPWAEKVAKSQGILVLLLTHESIYWHEAQTDITDRVVEVLKREGVQLPTKVSGEPTP